MGGGSFRFWSGPAVATLLGACSNLIGVSSYEIDPSLNDASGGAIGTAGTTSHAGRNDTDGGVPSLAVAGDDSGGSNVADTSAAGDVGTGHAAECETASDCDDTIDCTTDTCSRGTCIHTPKDSLCDGSRCETCKAGIGCLAGATSTVQLLADPGFDIVPASGDWDESGSEDVNIVTDPAAQTPTKIAKFGPGPAVGSNVDDQQYSDVFQYVTIPVGTVAIDLTGFYELAAGRNSPKDDQLQAALFPLECPDPDVDPNADPSCSVTKPFVTFHTFYASTGATTTWKAFSYSAQEKDVAKMAGADYSFDLVAYVWDTVFRVDSLQMNATVCR